MGVMVRMRESEVQREVPVSPSCQEGARVTSQPLTPIPHPPHPHPPSGLPPPHLLQAPHADILSPFLYFFGLSLFLLL